MSPTQQVKPQLLPDFDWSSVSDPAVVLKVFLNRGGTVTGAELMQGNSVLGKAAQAAILQWTFDIGSLSLPQHAKVIETVIPVRFVKPKQ